jgi:Dihydro-orotase-like
MKKFLLPFALFALFATQLSAQMADMHWDTHGVGFKVPANFKETTNNADEYTASNNNISLTIAPIQDGKLDEEHMAEVTLEMAKSLGYDSIEAADKAEIDDFKGYFIKGTKDGVHAIVMAMLDTKSTTNLLVVIVYADGFEDKAVEIADSFYAYDK